jgi:ubiquitin
MTKKPAPETWDDDDDDDEQEVARPTTPPRPRMPPATMNDAEPVPPSEGPQAGAVSRQSAPLVSEMPPLQTQIEDVGTSTIEKKFAGPTARVLQFRKANGLSNKAASSEQKRPPEQHYQAQPQQAAAQMRPPEQHYQAQPQQAAPMRQGPTPQPTSHVSEFGDDPIPGESHQIFVRPVQHRTSPLKVLGIAALFFGAAWALSNWMQEDEDDEEDDEEEEEVPEMEVPPSGLEDDVIEGEIVAS